MGYFKAYFQGGKGAKKNEIQKNDSATRIFTLSTIITSMIMVENDKLVDHVDDYIFVQTVHSVYTVFLFIQ